jgi:hypothetical protein
MDLNGLSSQVSGKIPAQPLVPPRTAMDRRGRVVAAYGSEDWEFESLRARLLPATMLTWTKSTRPKSDTFLILSAATIAACVFVQNISHVGAAGMPLKVVGFRRGQLGV